MKVDVNRNLWMAPKNYMCHIETFMKILNVYNSQLFLGPAPL